MWSNPISCVCTLWKWCFRVPFGLFFFGCYYFFFWMWSALRGNFLIPQKGFSQTRLLHLLNLILSSEIWEIYQKVCNSDFFFGLSDYLVAYYRGVFSMLILTWGIKIYSIFCSYYHRWCLVYFRCIYFPVSELLVFLPNLIFY